MAERFFILRPQDQHREPLVRLLEETKAQVMPRAHQSHSVVCRADDGASFEQALNALGVSFDAHLLQPSGFDPNEAVTLGDPLAKLLVRL